MLELILHLKQKLPNSDIKVIFHRGMGEQSSYPDEYKRMLASLDSLRVEYVNIAGSSQGFSIYDNCDLHIGYRGHAHIYNLSQRNISILIEEDGRGAGVNEALGLMRIKAYASKTYPPKGLTRIKNAIITAYNTVKRILPKRVQAVLPAAAITKLTFKSVVEKNPYLSHEIDDYLYLLQKSDYLQMTSAFARMRHYYGIMTDRINSLAPAP